MQDIPLGNTGTTIRGQEVIRTRAFDSVARLWNEYLPAVQASYNLPAPARYASIIAILDNTHIPIILNPFGAGSHAVPAYDHTSSGTPIVLINDPNYPGTTKQMTYDLANTSVLSYGQFPYVQVIGQGSFKAESFDAIYADAEAGFDGNGAAQVDITSHTDGQHVTSRTIQFTGTSRVARCLCQNWTLC